MHRYLPACQNAAASAVPCGGGYDVDRVQRSRNPVAVADTAVFTFRANVIGDPLGQIPLRSGAIVYQIAKPRRRRAALH